MKPNALLMASANGDIAAVERLLSLASTDVSVRDSTGQLTALHAACRYGHSKVVATLLQKGADPMARDVAGATPFQFAAFHGHEECARLLCEVAPALLSV